MRLLMIALLTMAICIFCLTATAFSESSASDKPACLTSFFTNSLHYTGEGMRRWYEEEGGFMDITKIPYEQLNCKSCHIKSCDQCHAKKKRAKFVFSPKKARDINTCLPCHGREGLTFKFDADRGNADTHGGQGNIDVHMAAGMVCADCHGRYDVHGDGRFRPSMRHPKGVRIECKVCHIDQERESPEFDPETASHQVHGDKLDCAACHVRSTMACYNCHFDNFLKTGRKKGIFIPMKDWLLLINYEGRVTSGSAMALVHENKKFIAYVPYYTHSIMSEGRSCESCHGNPAALQMKEGRKVEVVDFKDNQVITWKGVVPVVDGLLDWTFLNKTDKGWQPVPGSQPPKVQFAAYGTPLTQSQLQQLAEPQ